MYLAPSATFDLGGTKMCILNLLRCNHDQFVFTSGIQSACLQYLDPFFHLDLGVTKVCLVIGLTDITGLCVSHLLIIQSM